MVDFRTVLFLHYFKNKLQNAFTPVHYFLYSLDCVGLNLVANPLAVPVPDGS
jgi:hypothetical protein